MLDECTYHITPSFIHGSIAFLIDGVKVSYNREAKLMKYVGPMYKHREWLTLFKFMKCLCI